MIKLHCNPTYPQQLHKWHWMVSSLHLVAQRSGGNEEYNN